MVIRRDRGDGHHQAKLTETKVREIRLLYASGAHTQRALAHVYGVSQQAIRMAIAGKTWRHVPMEAQP
jgi:hypothetical protein